MQNLHRVYRALNIPRSLIAKQGGCCSTFRDLRTSDIFFSKRVLGLETSD
jgi:hypothetical protein